MGGIPPIPLRQEFIGVIEQKILTVLLRVKIQDHLYQTADQITRMDYYLERSHIKNYYPNPLVEIINEIKQKPKESLTQNDRDSIHLYTIWESCWYMSPALTISEIAKLISCDKHTVSKTIRNLYNKGLVNKYSVDDFKSDVSQYRGFNPFGPFPLYPNSIKMMYSITNKGQEFLGCHDDFIGYCNGLSYETLKKIIIPFDTRAKSSGRHNSNRKRGKPFTIKFGGLGKIKNGESTDKSERI